MPLARKTTVAACALLTAAALALPACGTDEEEIGVEEPAREGLAVPVGEVDYNVFITRQLNLHIPPDQAYYDGPDPGASSTYYGVFIQACNSGDEPRPTASRFKVLDNQGNEFEPKELAKENAFSYQPKVLQPKECLPEPGSAAQQGPAGGAMLLFELPLSITENRPLELEISGGAPPQTKKFELDI